MDSASDRRSKLRIVVGPDVTIQFQVKQFAYKNIRITNLSAGGCFATLPRAQNHLFRQGTLLEHFRFENPDLESEPFMAKVSYVLGGGGGGGRGALELIGLGIHFVAMTPSVEEMLRQYVDARA
jgi:c-di-GMP-binding flagellar brake protein YcgR